MSVTTSRPVAKCKAVLVFGLLQKIKPLMLLRVMRSVDQLSDLATVSDGDLLGRRSASASEGLDLVDDVHAVDDLAEDDVPPVEPGGGHGRDEELRSVGVRAGVGHGEHAGAGVLELEVLVLELRSVDGLAASAGAVGEVASLDHELRDDPVEGGVLVVEGLAGLAHALLASAERAEVLDGFGDVVAEEADHDPAEALAVGLDVEEDLVGDRGAAGLAGLALLGQLLRLGVGRRVGEQHRHEQHRHAQRDEDLRVSLRHLAQ
mmetsp:Transcript_9809/g.24474  ORF Transcript_9809/g.24474 Transcript_9809/m.24474 type:complete len:262 (+) Transcript_9809:106-891(+)